MELVQHLWKRLRTSQQINDVTFNRVKTHRMVDLLPMFELSRALLELLVGWSRENRFEITHENRRVDILADRLWSQAGEVAQV